MKRLERKWMYERLNDRKKIRLEFAIGVNKFIDNAKQQEEYILTKELKCPCLNCKNKKYLMVPVVKKDLCRLGFCPNYYKWTYHGEDDSDNQWDCNEPNISSYRSMVLDALGPDMLDNLEDPYMEEEECPNPQAKSFLGTETIYPLRQLCVHKVAKAENRSWVWWDYVTDVHIRCSMKDKKYTRTCADDVLKSLNLPAHKIKKCMGDQDADVESEVLKNEQDKQVGQGTRGDVTILPTLIINDIQYRGKLERTGALNLFEWRY